MCEERLRELDVSSALGVGDNHVSLFAGRGREDGARLFMEVHKERARDTFFTIMMIKHGNGPREVVDHFLGSVYWSRCCISDASRESVFAHQVSVHKLKLGKGVFCVLLSADCPKCLFLVQGYRNKQIGLHMTMNHTLHLCLHKTIQAGAHRGIFGFAVLKRSLQASSSAGLLT